jgi:hypothetical protein
VRVAEHGGDTMLPRIGIIWALYPGELAPPLRKRLAKKYRIVRWKEERRFGVALQRLLRSC